MRNLNHHQNILGEQKRLEYKLRSNQRILTVDIGISKELHGSRAGKEERRAKSLDDAR